MNNTKKAKNCADKTQNTRCECAFCNFPDGATFKAPGHGTTVNGAVIMGSQQFWDMRLKMKKDDHKSR